MKFNIRQISYEKTNLKEESWFATKVEMEF